jgi:hypothetical protein
MISASSLPWIIAFIYMSESAKRNECIFMRNINERDCDRAQSIQFSSNKARQQVAKVRKFANSRQRRRQKCSFVLFSHSFSSNLVRDGELSRFSHVYSLLTTTWQLITLVIFPFSFFYLLFSFAIYNHSTIFSRVMVERERN